MRNSRPVVPASGALARLGQNSGYFLLHALAVALAFAGLMGFAFQDSPKFGVYAATPAGKFWSAAGGVFGLASLFGIPALTIGSVIATIKGKVQAARYMCWASLLAAFGFFLSAISTIAGA